MTDAVAPSHLNPIVVRGYEDVPQLCSSANLENRGAEKRDVSDFSPDGLNQPSRPGVYAMACGDGAVTRDKILENHSGYFGQAAGTDR